MRSGEFCITLVTCEDQAELHPSDQILAEELERLGVRVRVAIWSDPGVDWARDPVTVLRSTWDAHLRPQEFRSWLQRVGTLTCLCNSAQTVQWNFDKQYLLDLQARNVRIIPTLYFERHATPGLCRADIPWESVVTKPAVGASSHGVRLFNADTELDALKAYLGALLEKSGALLQSYVSTVRTAAERSLVFIEGEYTHAVRRVPFNRGSTPDTGDLDHEASLEEIAFAERVLGAAGALQAAFARVDLLPSPDGILLMELELIEPSLFFTRKPSSAQRLAQVLRKKLESIG